MPDRPPDRPMTAEQIIATAFTSHTDRPTPSTMRRAGDAVAALIAAGLLADPAVPPPGTGMDDPVEIVMPRASWQRIALAAQESSDRDTVVDGICLGEALDDDVPETFTNVGADEFEPGPRPTPDHQVLDGTDPDSTPEPGKPSGVPVTIHYISGGPHDGPLNAPSAYRDIQKAFQWYGRRQ